MTPTVWQAAAPAAPSGPAVPLFSGLARGLTGACPACGHGHAFQGFLKIVPECRTCGAPLGSARADDAPPYFTILIVGHLVVPAMLVWQRAADPPSWELASVFLPLTAALCLALLRPIKGAVLGAMVAFGMLKQDGQQA
ncbi:MAG TPA: DUF983 domain-containing protein [Acetobacteraceae bacterium]|nr:DUF983 domain-containing protein [Acetobacteraceae bacterium]